MSTLRRLHAASLGACLLSVAALVTTIPVERARAASPTQPKVKDTSYSVAASPYIPPDIDARPVAVVGVTTDAETSAGWRIREVEVEGHAESATALRLTTYVSLRSSPGVVRHRWQTDEIALPGTLKAAGRVKLPVELLGHRDLLLLRSETARDFQVDIAVTEVRLANGRIWSADEVSRLVYMTPEQLARKAETSTLFKNAAYATASATQNYQCYAVCVYHYVGQGQCPSGCWYYRTGCEYCSGPCSSCPPGWICTCSPSYYDCGQPNPSPTKCRITGAGAGCTVTYPCP